jgi:hypothetical protein
MVNEKESVRAGDGGVQFSYIGTPVGLINIFHVPHTYS